MGGFEKGPPCRQCEDGRDSGQHDPRNAVLLEDPQEYCLRIGQRGHLAADPRTGVTLTDASCRGLSPGGKDSRGDSGRQSSRYFRNALSRLGDDESIDLTSFVCDRSADFSNLRGQKPDLGVTANCRRPEDAMCGYTKYCQAQWEEEFDEKYVKNSRSGHSSPI